jgi:regulator of protease activity HflC (stomatin/prohibitin superfamily)
MMIVAGMLALTGCSRIPTGSVGIEQTFSGHIYTDPVDQGLYSSWFTTYYAIDTTLTRATVKGMQPKDSHGVALQDVSVVVTYRLDPARVGAFYQRSKEMDPEPDSDLHTLGLGILEQSVVPYAVQIATEHSDLATISSHLADYANTIQTIADKRLHELYPDIDPFVIQSVTVPTFDLPTAIQNQMNAKAGYQAELETLAAQMQVIEQRKALKVAQASIDAQALAAAAKATGLSPAEVIDWKRAEAFQTLAQHGSAVIVNTANH